MCDVLNLGFIDAESIEEAFLDIDEYYLETSSLEVSVLRLKQHHSILNSLNRSDSAHNFDSESCLAYVQELSIANVNEANSDAPLKQLEQKLPVLSVNTKKSLSFRSICKFLMTPIRKLSKLEKKSAFLPSKCTRRKIEMFQRVESLPKSRNHFAANESLHLADHFHKCGDFVYYMI